MSEDLVTKEIEDALKSPEVPKFYANGFSNAIGIGDISMLFKNGNKPVVFLNLSYTVAKTLVEKLGFLISVLEDKTGTTIMTTDKITKDLSEKNEKR